HHVIFRRIRHRRLPPQCTSSAGEAFYSTGEEDQTLRFPPGYGYRVRRTDRWRVTAMLMSHEMRINRVYLQYRVTTDTHSRLRPVLHEPGPMDTRYFLSGSGIPVAAGEILRLSATYDGEHPHWAVMSTMHVYLAFDRAARRTSCRPLPRDRRSIVKPGAARSD